MITSDYLNLLENARRCDILIIGTEGTGARAAIEASELGADVLAITKGLPAKSGATLTAGGEIAVDSRSACDLLGLNGIADDSPEQFATDMIRAGGYLADQRLVAIHTIEAPRRVKELVDWGARIDDFMQGPGHSYPRGVWIPGVKVAKVLKRRFDAAKIPVLANTMALELLTDDEGVVGALALDIASGQVILIQSRSVILATGGAMRVFPLVTAPEELTGDGLAMALRSGASLQDIEFPMFLPYCFATPSALRGVVFPYDLTTLLDAWALNSRGERYMARWDSKNFERTTRDINTVAAALEIRSGRGSPNQGTYLSFAHLPRNLVRDAANAFPVNIRNWQAYGFDLNDFFADPGTDAWEVAPACHFWNGGVRINDQCATGIPGLFAAGEGTAGIHGANRLSGNGLTMTQVWGKRAGAYAREFSKHTENRLPDPEQVMKVIQKLTHLTSSPKGVDPIEVRNELRHIAGEYVGVIRDQKRLEQSIEKIQSLRKELPLQRLRGYNPIFNRELVEAIQNENQLDVLEAIAIASLQRQESRGALYRSDYPMTDDDNGLCNFIIERKAGVWKVRKEAVKEEYVTLPRGQKPYGKKG